MASKGFIELLRIADLARARKSGRRGGKEFDWQGVVFEIGGQRLVAPMGQVSEVLSMPEYTSLPLVKPWMLGIANIRGRLLPLTDLSRFLQVPSRLPQKGMALINRLRDFAGFGRFDPSDIGRSQPEAGDQIMIRRPGQPQHVRQRPWQRPCGRGRTAMPAGRLRCQRSPMCRQSCQRA